MGMYMNHDEGELTVPFKMNAKNEGKSHFEAPVNNVVKNNTINNYFFENLNNEMRYVVKYSLL